MSLADWSSSLPNKGLTCFDPICAAIFDGNNDDVDWLWRKLQWEIHLRRGWNKASSEDMRGMSWDKHSNYHIMILVCQKQCPKIDHTFHWVIVYIHQIWGHSTFKQIHDRPNFDVWLEKTAPQERKDQQVSSPHLLLRAKYFIFMLDFKQGNIQMPVAFWTLTLPPKHNTPNTPQSGDPQLQLGIHIYIYIYI